MDGGLIEPAEVVRLVSRIRPIVDQLEHGDQSGGLTTYEIGTAVTLSYFAERHVDLGVLDPGD